MEDTLIIGILYFPEEPNSRREALELYKVLKAYKSKTLVNLQMSAFLFSCGCGRLWFGYNKVASRTGDQACHAVTGTGLASERYEQRESVSTAL